MLLNFYSEH
jgi:hypothetical protein